VPTQQVQSLLYNTCDDSTQNNIINTIPNFLTLSEHQLLQEIETIVTQKAYATVYRMKFSAISQHENELVRTLYVLVSHQLKTVNSPVLAASMTSLHRTFRINLSVVFMTRHFNLTSLLRPHD